LKIYFEMEKKTITISVYNIIADKTAMDVDQGQKIFERIDKAFKESLYIDVSFQNIELITTAFLNTAFGQLYRDHKEDFIREHLKTSNLTNSGMIKLKKVVETAKLYYKDPKALEQSIKDILED